MIRIRLAVILLGAIGLLFVVSCGGEGFEEQPAAQAPQGEVEVGPGEVQVPDVEVEVAEELQLSCAPLNQPEPGPKPALSLEGQEPAFSSFTWTSERVIGFAFDGGSLAMAFSPASGICEFNDPGLGQVAGVVFVARDPGQFNPDDEEYWLPLLLTVEPDSNTGFLIDESLVVLEGFDYGVTTLEQVGDDPYPIDGGIRSDSLCIQMQDGNGNYKRFCSSANGRLSVRGTFGDAYDALVAGLISEAEGVLLEEEIASQMPEEVIAPLMEEEVSIREMAISEVVSGPYIGECNFENCPADVVVAPFGPSQRSVAHLGILSVRQTLLDPDGEAILGFGKYILHADKDDNGEPILPLYVSGLDEESGEVISYVEMPSSLASLVNPETNDAGEVAISGCKLWKVCLFWEWRC